MKIKELIEHLNTLDKEARIFLQYDSFMWYNLDREWIAPVNEEDTEYREAQELGVSVIDFKIELG